MQTQYAVIPKIAVLVISDMRNLSSKFECSMGFLFAS